MGFLKRLLIFPGALCVVVPRAAPWHSHRGRTRDVCVLVSSARLSVPQAGPIRFAASVPSMAPGRAGAQLTLNERPPGDHHHNL